MRIVTLAAVAAVFATSAGAQTIRVPVAGKSVDELHADIVKAARTICFRSSATYVLQDYVSCRQSVVETALANSKIPELMAMGEPASTLASR